MTTNSGSFSFDVPEPIFAQRDFIDPLPYPSSSSELGDLETNRLDEVEELPSPGLANLKAVCYADRTEFKGPGQPWPLIYRPGTTELEPKHVKYRFCSPACCRAWLAEHRDATQADHERLLQYAAREFGFLLCYGEALPLRLLFMVTNVTIEEFRSFGEYYVLNGEPEKSRIKPEWLTSPTIEGLFHLEHLRVFAAQFYAKCTQVPSCPKNVCYHHDGPLDRQYEADQVAYPVPVDSQSSPHMLFCGFPCFLFWMYNNKNVNRSQTLTKLRQLHLKRYKTLELPLPACDRTMLLKYNSAGLTEADCFKPFAGLRIFEQQNISLAGMTTGVTKEAAANVVAAGSTTGSTTATPELTASEDLMRDVMATFKTLGPNANSQKKHDFDHAQNALHFERTGPCQTYRANGMTLKTGRRVPKKNIISDTKAHTALDSAKMNPNAVLQQLNALSLRQT
jgi:hypothetical protein